MIVEYWRPTTISAALDLLARREVKTIPIGGGTRFGRDLSEDLALVDTQQLGLNQITEDEKRVTIDAAVKIQQLAEADQLPEALRKAAQQAGGLNFRNQATIAGEIFAGNGRSMLLTALLALNAELFWAGESKGTGIGDFLALRESWPSAGLLIKIVLPTQVTLAMEFVARTPVDQPILIVGVCNWPSGRTRVALGGTGKAPILALDSPLAAGAEHAVSNAYLHAGDVWASAEYRSQVAGELVSRLISVKGETK